MKRLLTSYSAFLLIFLVGSYSPASDPPGIVDERPETTMSQFEPLDAATIDGWTLQTGSQSCKGALVDAPDALYAADFEFTNSEEIEYLGAFGKMEIAPEREGQYIGVRATVEADSGDPSHCPFNVRFRDASGETHQIGLRTVVGEWRFGQIKASNPHWGGDNDGVLQFPCSFDELIVDRAEQHWRAKGRAVVKEIRFFKKNPVERIVDAALLDAPDENDRANLAPFYFDADSAATRSVKIAVRPTEKFKDASIELDVVRQVDGKTLPMERVALKDWNETVALSTSAGFEAIQILPSIKDADGRVTYGAPLKFSFAALPKVDKLNGWFGLSTHRNALAIERVPRAGAGLIRDEFHWGYTEPEKGKFVFNADVDAFYDRVHELGLEPLVILDYSNALYNGGDFPYDDESVAGFARYCGKMAEHLKGRCRYFEIWNEWTGGCGMSGFMAKKHNSPENYVKLIAAASKEIRKANPDAYIVGGGGDHHTYHFAAIEAEMKLGVMKYCDAYSVHPYVYPTGPERANCKADLQKIVDVMRANGCENPKLWLTEQGWPTYRGLTSSPEVDSSSLALEDYSASMMARSAIIYKSVPEIETYYWYDLEDDGTDLHYNENNFGVVHNRVYGASPKASFVSLTTLSRLLDGATVVEAPKYATEGRCAYEIRRPNEKTVLAIWKVEGEEPFDLPGARAFGIYGNELKDGERKISPRPIFFELSE